MRLSVALFGLATGGRAGELVGAARAAEDSGYDAVFVPDHPTRTNSGGFLDPLVALSMIAGATRTIRLGISVLVVPYRNPILLANEAASLDALSGGRLILGVGSGHVEKEFEALGVSARQRGARTDEHLRVVWELWTGESVTFDGRFTSLHGTRLSTQPLTSGGPPIWVGGNSDAALRRSLRFGEAWHGLDIQPEEMSTFNRRLERLGEETGRDPATLELTNLYFPHLPSVAAVVDHLRRLAEGGISHCVVAMPGSVDAATDAMRQLAQEATRAGLMEQNPR